MEFAAPEGGGGGDQHQPKHRCESDTASVEPAIGFAFGLGKKQRNRLSLQDRGKLTFFLEFRTFAAVMDNRAFPDVIDGIAVFSNGVAQVYILSEHEISLVEKSNFLENRSLDHHTGPNKNFTFLCFPFVFHCIRLVGICPTGGISEASALRIPITAAGSRESGRPAHSASAASD